MVPPPPELHRPAIGPPASKRARAIAIDGSQTQSLRYRSSDLHDTGFNLRGSAMLYEPAKPKLYAYY